MKLSTRERLWVGVFIVALVWGAYNYRHLWVADRTPAAGSRITQPRSAPPGGPAAASRQTTKRGIADPGREGAFQAPPWSDDPFNRPWRRATGTPVEKTPSRG